MIKRKAYSKLLEWKNTNNKKCLIVDGARQVGKTFIVREFGKKEYEQLIELNFIETPSYKNVFSENLDANTVISAIKLANPNAKITNGKTLLFLDEIQECPEAITSLKFLNYSKNIDIICSGSALGMSYNQANSFPVGNVEYLDMYPLDFEEFLWAIGVDDDTIKSLYHYFTEKEKVPVSIHQSMMQYLKQYMVIGGMPEVVSTFLESNDYYEADRIQRRIYRDYITDIAHLASPDIKIKAEKCYKSISRQLMKENHKFQYSQVEKKGTSRKFESSLDWLINAHMVIAANNVNSLQYPLQSFEIENNFRIYPNDIGLLICTYPFELKAEILRDNNTEEKAENIILQTAKGGIYEALAADFLHKAKFQNLHFYRNEAGTVEMEFLIESTQGIIPVEIKAGRKGSRSLNTIISDNKIKYGYKFSSQNIGTIDKKVTMPLYMMMFLGKEV